MSWPYAVLTVGTEQAVLQRASSVRRRIFAYGALFRQMHIILLSGKTSVTTDTEGNVTVYPTNSWMKIKRYIDAIKIGKRVEHVDIVTVQDPFETGLVGLMIAQARRVPLHVQVHTDFLAPAFARHSLVNRIRVSLAGFVLRRAARIRVVSPRIERSIRSRYGALAPISVLPIFVDTEKFRTASPGPMLADRFGKFSHRLLILARLEPEKGADLALESFAAAAPGTACLIIVGDGSERTPLTARAQKLGVASRVFFEGARDPAPYVALADLVLVPSAYEGYGLVIIEALSAGKPVLATDVGIARDAGAIVSSPEEYVHALAHWFGGGERVGTLKDYPYASFDEYVDAYCADIAACLGR